MLVVDLMHECELGTWKALFTHLIRLLYALPQGSQLVATFDGRYEDFVQNTAYRLVTFTSDFARSQRSVTALFGSFQTIPPR
jgi:hypothetical protein